MDNKVNLYPIKKESETLRINLNIFRKKYSVTVKREQEEIYRKAAKKLNELIKSYNKKYHIKGNDDILVLSALHLSRDMIENKNKTDETEKFKDEIQELEKELEDYLKELH